MEFSFQTAELQNVDVSNGTYVAGDTIELTANFDSAVTVTGTPRIELTLDSGTVFCRLRQRIWHNCTCLQLLRPGRRP